MSIKGLDNFVYIDKDSHRYFDRNGVEYMSASKFIGLFYKKFDAESVSGHVARAEGVTKQEVLDKWQAQTDNGTEIHESIELFNKTTQILPKHEKFIPAILNISGQYRSYYRLINEQILHDKDELIAGTTDLLGVCTSSYKSIVDLGDWKTYNKGINQKEVDKEGNFRNEYMLGPLSHLQNSSYNKVALQLSLYSYMFQKLTGRKIGKLFAHWIDPKNPLINKQVPVNYMYYEVIAMLEWRKSNAIPLEVPEPNKSVLQNFGNDNWL